MIKDRTVIVLGAGASSHLNYPTGKKLIDSIIIRLKKNSEMYNFMYDIFGDVRVIDNFRDALKYSARYSIDEFLEHRPEFIEIGKVSIAYILMPYENREYLFNDSTDNWYRYFFSKLNISFDKFVNNKISIVTFNYDRSLEEYLFVALKNSYGVKDEDVSSVLNEFNILHVHGKLGDLNWQNTSGRAYKAENNIQEIIESARNIKIIHEDDMDISNFWVARDLMEVANKIIFIGFGYHEINMKRLEINKIQNKTIIGSSYGLSRLEARTIENRYINCGLSLPGNESDNAFEFIRNNVVMI